MASTSSPGTSRTHLEIETKLDADPNFVLPDLSGRAGVVAIGTGVVHELEAIYLDSDDLRLIRHGTTLRRRTGGPDAGWHLKLPAAKHGRIEVQRELGRSEQEVPKELLGLVRVQLRDEPVGPVARITTRRTVHTLLGAGDVVLAEVADDEVVAESMGSQLTTSRWREIEVELVDGDESVLEAAGTALIAAGARPSASASKLQRALGSRLSAIPSARTKSSHRKSANHRHRPTAGSVVQDYLARQVQVLIAEDPRVRISADDAVHQMRVSTRRMRTALASFRPLFTDRAGEPLRAELKWLGGLLGQARDAEVMRGRLTAELAEQPDELVLGPVRRRIDLELGQAYQEAHQRVVAELDGDRYLALVTALEEFVEQPPFSPRATEAAPEELRRLVRRACRRVQSAAAGLTTLPTGADRTAQDHHLHEVRIAAKRARYAAETARPAIGRPAKRVATAMEEVTETLGNHQDAVVERQWLRDLAVRAFLAGENGFTFGRLHGLTDARAQHDEDHFAEVWTSTRKVIAAWPG